MVVSKLVDAMVQHCETLPLNNHSGDMYGQLFTFYEQPGRMTGSYLESPN